jgi:hypothetical protein
VRSKPEGDLPKSRGSKTKTGRREEEAPTAAWRGSWSWRRRSARNQTSVRRRPAAAGAPEGNERERLGEEAVSGDRREAAAALRRVERRGEEEAAEGWRQTARVEIWVGRLRVEGTEASVAGAVGVRREREREKDAKGRLGSSRGRGRAAGSASEAAAMGGGGGS